MHSVNEDILTSKIYAFIRKFYLSKMIKGTFVGAFSFIAIWLIFNSIEYVSWLPNKGRLALLLTAALLYTFIFVFYFALPSLNLLRFRKKMTLKQASVLIGKFFPDIKDKLLNTLELSENINENTDNELLIASVEQRTNSFKVFTFSDAVDLKENRKYARVFAIAAVVLIILMIFLPDFSIKPAQRIVNYSQHFEPPLPYSVTLSDTLIYTTENSDVEFFINVDGKDFPDAFRIKTENTSFLMNRLSLKSFNFIFKKIHQNVVFHVEGGDFISRDIKIVVNPNPSVLFYDAKMTYPSYIGRKNDVYSLKQNFLVPQGTNITLSFTTKNVDSLFIDDKKNSFSVESDDEVFVYSFTALESAKLNISLSNKWVSKTNFIPITVDVKTDMKPEITVQEFHENFAKKYFYSGIVADDYGFSTLKVHFDFDDNKAKSFAENVVFDKKNKRSSFFYSIDLDTFNIAQGENISLYFEIFDNDAVNGAKAARSKTFFLSLIPDYQLDSVADAKSDNIIKDLEDKISAIDKMREKTEEILRDLLSKKDLDWSDKEKMKELVENYNSIMEEWRKIQEEQQKLADFMEDNELVSDELKKKLDELNELFDEKTNDETLTSELEKMLDEMSREEMQQMVKDLRLNNQQLQNMMDRNMSLFEQFKVEKDLNDFIDEINSLADKLEKNTENESISAEDALDEFKKLEEKLDSIAERNENLKHPFDINKDEQMEQSIENDLNEAAEQEQNNEQEGASEKKKSASKKMRKMSSSMQLNFQMGQMQQNAEDAALVRILLENTVRSSHHEEILLNDVAAMKKDDPSISEKITIQKEIADNFVMVADSLRALGKRQAAVKEFVFNELHDVSHNINMSMEEMQNNHFQQASSHQQRAMMAMNNLALMLAESLNDIESMMNMGGAGKQSCSNPQSGQGEEKSMEQMRQAQEQLGEKLKEMQKKGQQQSGDNPAFSNEDFARMAAQQEMLRREMEKMLSNLKEQGVLGDDGLNQIIAEMKEIEKDLVNKNITERTIRRNKNITSRMLKAQNAQEEREKDDKRESEESKNSYENVSPSEIEFENAVKRQQDFLKTKDIEFQPFYQKKINDYFIRKSISH